MIDRLLFAIYATAPAIAFFFPLRKDGIGWWVIFAAPINYIFFAFPFLLWFLIVHLNKLSKPVLHAGMIGVAASLVVLTIVLDVGNENQMGWIVYYPLAATVSSIFAVITYAFTSNSKPPA